MCCAVCVVVEQQRRNAAGLRWTLKSRQDRVSWSGSGQEASLVISLLSAPTELLVGSYVALDIIRTITSVQDGGIDSYSELSTTVATATTTITATATTPITATATTTTTATFPRP